MMKGVNNENEHIAGFRIVPQGNIPTFLKIKKTGEIVEGVSFSPGTRLYVVKSDSGKPSEIPEGECSSEVTEDEKIKFHGSQNKKSNWDTTTPP